MKLLTWMPPTPPDDADDKSSATSNKRLKGYRSTILLESEQPMPHSARLVWYLYIECYVTSKYEL